MADVIADAEKIEQAFTAAHEPLPADLQAVLADPSITIPRDTEVWNLLGRHYVSQKGADDCGVAVLAMLTGRTLGDTMEWINWNGKPVEPWEMQHALWSDGWYLRVARMPKDLGQEGWPPLPFADAHYAMVTASRGGHWTMMDASGRVFDPWDRSRSSLVVYGAVHEVVGLKR